MLIIQMAIRMTLRFRFGIPNFPKKDFAPLGFVNPYLDLDEHKF